MPAPRPRFAHLGERLQLAPLRLHHAVGIREMRALVAQLVLVLGKDLRR